MLYSKIYLVPSSAFFHITCFVNSVIFVRVMMSPKKSTTKLIPKKAPKTIEMKKEIIRKYEEGKRIIDIAREIGKASSTITTVLKKKEDIKGFVMSMDVTLTTSKKKWLKILKEVEKLLFVWINEKQLTGGSIGEVSICEKVWVFYDDFIR